MQSTVYADIIKVETDPINPAYRLVHARISDETKDLDGQRADYNWLKEAVPDWFKWGNVRDMHGDNVVGRAHKITEIPEQRGFDGVLKIVDPTAVMKLDEELFNGVSIGIKGPGVYNEKGVQVHPSQPGWIKKGKIVEVSLVDHPCNESCKLTVLKSAGNGLDLVKGAQLEILNKALFADITKGLGAYWNKRAKWNAEARRQATSTGHAMEGGRFPIDDASDVSDAVHLYTTGHGQTPDVKAHIQTQAKRLGIKNPFKRKNQGKVADAMVTPADLETYQKRFDPAFASQGLSLSDGSYVIMDEGDLFLAKGLLLTGFGNTVAADLLIKRRETELVDKAAGATQQSTPDQSQVPLAPGARDNRDNPAKGAPAAAKPKKSKNKDKDTPAHQSPDASGSQAAYADEHAGGHPPTKAKKKPKAVAGPASDAAGEVGPFTHGADSGPMGTQTDTAKGSKVKQKIKTVWTKKYADGDPADWSDKKLTKAAKSAQELMKMIPPGTASTGASGGNSDIANSGPQSFGFDRQDRNVQDFQRGGAGSPGGGRALLEQLVRNMQGRLIDLSQGPQSVDTGRGGSGGPDAPDEAGETGPTELLNQSGLMRDGDPRINANTPESALGQSGPMNGGDSKVSSGGDSGVPNTSFPFGSTPQPGATSQRTSPGNLPGTLAAPGDAAPVISSGGPGGGGGTASAAPPQRAAAPAAQSGTDANAGHRTIAGSPQTAFAYPDRQPGAPGTASGTGARVGKDAKPDKKGKKWRKRMKKVAKASAPKLVAADSTKAVVAGLLKKFVKDLERTVLVKYATAEQIKGLRDDVDRLGAMAAPGGPFIGKIVAADKEFAANDFANPGGGEIPAEALEQMERYEKLSKSDNRQLSISAKAELTKLMKHYFPGQDTEVVVALNKRKRSTAR